MVKLSQSLQVNGTMVRSPVPVAQTIQDYVVQDQMGMEYATFSLPINDEVPVDYINIIYTGSRLEVMGIGNNKPVFLMTLSNVAMRQLTSKWLTKL